MDVCLAYFDALACAAHVINDGMKDESKQTNQIIRGLGRCACQTFSVQYADRDLLVCLMVLTSQLFITTLVSHVHRPHVTI